MDTLPLEILVHIIDIGNLRSEMPHLGLVNKHFNRAFRERPKPYKPSEMLAIYKSVCSSGNAELVMYYRNYIGFINYWRHRYTTDMITANMPLDYQNIMAFEITNTALDIAVRAGNYEYLMYALQYHYKVPSPKFLTALNYSKNDTLRKYLTRLSDSDREYGVFLLNYYINIGDTDAIDYLFQDTDIGKYIVIPNKEMYAYILPQLSMNSSASAYNIGCINGWHTFELHNKYIAPNIYIHDVHHSIIEFGDDTLFDNVKIKIDKCCTGSIYRSKHKNRLRKCINLGHIMIIDKIYTNEMGYSESMLDWVSCIDEAMRARGDSEVTIVNTLLNINIEYIAYIKDQGYDINNMVLENAIHNGICADTAVSLVKLAHEHREIYALIKRLRTLPLQHIGMGELLLSVGRKFTIQDMKSLRSNSKLSEIIVILDALNLQPDELWNAIIPYDVSPSIEVIRYLINRYGKPNKSLFKSIFSNKNTIGILLIDEVDLVIDYIQRFSGVDDVIIIECLDKFPKLPIGVINKLRKHSSPNIKVLPLIPI